MMSARRPASTYRLQIRAGFDLFAAADLVPYLRDLGVSWVYLSPILASGSDHGYDVVDPTRIDDVRGGAAGLGALTTAAHESGLGVLVDIVPNHMGVADPARAPWWWDVLARGRTSRWAPAFDIDWEHGAGRVRLPILGAPPADVLAAGEITIDADAGVARYHDHTLPLASGSLDGLDLADVAAVLERQHWEAVFWRDEHLLNYRRFFTVTTLAGVRVEDPDVFDAAHAEIVRWFDEGLVDGLRIDHPDGLADPGGYLDRLAEATGHPYVVVEKILERGEQVPAWWATDGTTGYDALAEIDRVLTDPAGEPALTALAAAPGDAPTAYVDLVHDTKRAVADTSLRPEVLRVVRLLPDGVPPEAWPDAVAEMLANFPVYRAYLPDGTEHLDHAELETARRRPDLAELARRLGDLLRAEPYGELARRFMQTTGPVMAKGVEDRAFYRYPRLTSLTEVGGDPAEFALEVAAYHDAATRRQARRPHTLTALSTHDTKRSEDTRARIAVLAEMPDRWRSVLGALREIAATGDAALDDLLWQAIVGVWPAETDRLRDYALKAAREAASHTTWTDPDPVFEARVHGLVDAAHGPAAALLDAVVAEIDPHGRANALAAKLLQLAGPGIPDVYQGTELWDRSLVDPDNRRDVDFATRRELLADLDAGRMPPVDDTGAAKLLVVSRTLRLRRDRPDLFTRYTPLPTVGPAASHAVAFDRGGVVAVATRLPAGLAARGGWEDTAVLRPSGAAVDAFTGRRFTAAAIPLADLLDTYPVALLVPDGGDRGDVSA